VQARCSAPWKWSAAKQAGYYASMLNEAGVLRHRGVEASLGATIGYSRWEVNMTQPRRNVQVIDSAVNCVYDIFSMPDEDFVLMFPDGQDIEFIDDFVARVGEETATRITEAMWKCRQKKSEIHGLHGTLFFELDNKKMYYPTKRDDEVLPYCRARNEP
jgi:hypothetical protein